MTVMKTLLIAAAALSLSAVTARAVMLESFVEKEPIAAYGFSAIDVSIDFSSDPIISANGFNDAFLFLSIVGIDLSSVGELADATGGTDLTLTDFSNPINFGARDIAVSDNTIKLLLSDTNGALSTDFVIATFAFDTSLGLTADTWLDADDGPFADGASPSAAFSLAPAVIPLPAGGLLLLSALAAFPVLIGAGSGRRSAS